MMKTRNVNVWHVRWDGGGKYVIDVGNIQAAIDMVKAAIPNFDINSVIEVTRISEDALTLDTSGPHMRTKE